MTRTPSNPSQCISQQQGFNKYDKDKYNNSNERPSNDRGRDPINDRS